MGPGHLFSQKDIKWSPDCWDSTGLDLCKLIYKWLLGKETFDLQLDNIFNCCYLVSGISLQAWYQANWLVARMILHALFDQKVFFSTHRSSVQIVLRKYIKHERQCFIGMSKHWEESWKFDPQRCILHKIWFAWIANGTLSWVFDISFSIKTKTKE